MNDKITIAEVISLVDSLKPNVRTDEEKRLWLNNLDRMIYEDIILTHEGSEEVTFDGYDEDTPDDQELLVPKHYGAEIYRFFLEMQIDLANVEYNRYNVSSALFMSAYENYEKAYNRQHMPLQPVVKSQTRNEKWWVDLNAI